MTKKKVSVKKNKKNSKSIPKQFHINKVLEPKKARPISEEDLELVKSREVALDFSTRVYERFSRIVKSIVLFGSSAKNTDSPDSDVDIIIIVDDASVIWDEALIGWYREELRKLISSSKYARNLHITTTKLTTWWDDMLRGDPVVINILRYGEAILDFGGFFNPLKILLQQGRIRSSPEAIFTALQRAPVHLSRSKAAEINCIDGVYWSMVDSSHAALMAAKVLPPSPEHIPVFLKETFVDAGLLKMKYLVWYRDVYDLYHKIMHGHVKQLRGADIDTFQVRADEFLGVMSELVKKLIGLRDNERK